MYVHHSHIEDRKVKGPPTVKEASSKVHGNSKIGNLNAKLAVGITGIIGTMWAAYLFTIIALVSAPAAFSSGDNLIIVAWVAQTFLQLVLLPIIIVGQNVLAKAADARSQATYDDATAILEEVKNIQKHLAQQDEEFKKVVNK